MEVVDKLYSDVGNKIKVLAKTLFIIFTVVFLIVGLTGICSAVKGFSSVNNNNTVDQLNEDGTWYRSSDMTEETRSIMRKMYSVKLTTSILILFLGPIVSWIGTWCLYGFGELIFKVSHIDDIMNDVSIETLYISKDVNRIKNHIREPNVSEKKTVEMQQKHGAENQQKTSYIDVEIKHYSEESLANMDSNHLSFLYANDRITKEEYMTATEQKNNKNSLP